MLSTLEHDWAFVQIAFETAIGTTPATACETAVQGLAKGVNGSSKRTAVAFASRCHDQWLE